MGTLIDFVEKKAIRDVHHLYAMAKAADEAGCPSDVASYLEHARIIEHFELGIDTGYADGSPPQKKYKKMV